MTDNTELLPCAHCNDPMICDDRSGIIRHTLEARQREDCPFSSYAFTDIQKWNTRPAQGHDALVEALKPFAFLDMGKDEDEGAAFTTTDVWEVIYQDRVKDWFDFADIKRARNALTNLPTPQAEEPLTLDSVRKQAEELVELTKDTPPCALHYVTSKINAACAEGLGSLQPQAEGELAFVGRLERVTAELDRIAHDNERFGQSPALDRDTAERAIHQIYGLYECKAGTTGSGYAWTSLQNILGLYAPRIPVSPQAEEPATLSEAFKLALDRWKALPEDERNGERPFIMGCNAGWDACMEQYGPQAEASPLDDGLVAELERLDKAATPAPFYRFDQPWLPPDCNTAILAESPDPHVARFICDFDFVMMDKEEDRLSECPDADADLLIWLRNHVPEILTALRARPSGDGGWQPIETAPESIECLVAIACEHSWATAAMKEPDGRWFNVRDGLVEPTHWQPLPEPPALSTIKGEG